MHIILGHPQVVGAQLDGLMERHKDLFTSEQIESLVSMMTKITSLDGALSDEQNSLLIDVTARLSAPAAADGTWNQRV